jgi:hypothetical protein
MRRSGLNEAPYNPRHIQKDNARRLRENLRKVGLVGPALVFNRRTGRLVSGHQRLAQLDFLEEYDGSPEKDYQLDVTVVDWAEKTEKRQNVFFNNPRAQGDWDLERLGELVADDLSGLEGFGLDAVEIGQLFPDDERFGSLFPDLAPEESTMPTAKGALDAIEAAKDEERTTQVRGHERRVSSLPAGPAGDDADLDGALQVGGAGNGAGGARGEGGAAGPADQGEAYTQEYRESVAERRYAYTDQLTSKTRADFYVVVVCRNDAHCRELLDAIGVQDVNNRYVGGEMVLAAMR